MRILAVVALILVGLLIAFALGAFDAADEGAPDELAFGVDEETVGLEGRVGADALPANPYGEVSDWEVLVKQGVWGREARAAWNARLAALGAADPRIIEEMIERLRARYDVDRRNAPTGSRYSTSAPLQAHVHWIQQALLAIGTKAVGPLTAALSDPQETLRERVARALMLFGADAAPAASEAARIAKDASADPRHSAIMVDLLGMIGPEAISVTPFLHDQLRRGDAHEAMEGASARAIYRIEGASERVLETYSMVLRGEWLGVRLAVLHVVQGLGAEASPLMLDVLALLDDDSEDRLHAGAVAALQAMGRADPNVLDKLGAWTEEPPYRGADFLCGRALAGLGRDGQRRLALAAERVEPSRRGNHVEILAQAHAPADLVLPLLPALLEDQNQWNRRAGLLALSRVTHDAETTWPWLKRHLASESRDEHFLARLAITAMDGPPAEALTVLDVALKTNTMDVSSIDLVAVKSPDVLERIFASEKAEDPDVRYAFAEMLRSAPADLEDRAVETLIRLLDDENLQVVRASAETLGYLGEPAKSALPLLTRRRAALKDDPKLQWLYWTFNTSIDLLGQFD